MTLTSTRALMDRAAAAGTARGSLNVLHPDHADDEELVCEAARLSSLFSRAEPTDLG
ncbi:hypothetical protein [Arthrobacter sp. zg-Y1171]|uniref:hypothetical protein n=1 Tax=Arthrobacter sp. zg-Y1171 TaxID=2964610 RepID=UPI002104454A|nr:hypothetical protein [Arthrobacter sp. zg-Y1171]MCQ1996776.1 hypothetical protein [Arthrobacter sp. zg-Y1171]UWX82370.1 hypothetical protein N2L00_02740 [Arthrobacter sp. zg-Y1171]